MKRNIQDKIIKFVKSNYQLLDLNKFIKGNTFLNARGHLNSVQAAFDKGYKVLLTICVGNDSVFVHFINEDSKNNYIDNTLGWYGQELYDYYLIREVSPSEYRSIWNLLSDTKEMLININSNWLERKLGFVKSDDV